MYVNRKIYDQTNIAAFTFVSKGKQQEAVLFLNTNVFNTPL